MVPVEEVRFLLEGVCGVGGVGCVGGSPLSEIGRHCERGCGWGEGEG